ncbi:MAG: PAS domain-containing protein, partial [Acidobacteriaceae bacterium]
MPLKFSMKGRGGIKPGQTKAGEKTKESNFTNGEDYRALVEQVPAVIYTDSVDKLYKTLYINPQIKNLTGFEAEEWLNDDDLWYKIIHPEDRDHVMDEYTRTYYAQLPSISEYRIIRRDGKVIWVSDETQLIRDDEGKPLFWQGVMIDITWRKHTEQVRQAIFRISHAVVTTASLDELYRSIHGILSELMPIMNLFIALYDAEKDLLSFPYYVDQYDEPPAPAKPQHGLTEYVLRTKKPLWAPPPEFSSLVARGEVEVIGTDSVDWI